jgi:hypothetical protein
MFRCENTLGPSAGLPSGVVMGDPHRAAQNVESGFLEHCRSPSHRVPSLNLLALPRCERTYTAIPSRKAALQ